MSMFKRAVIVGLVGASCALATPQASGAGADILMGNFGSTGHYGPVGTIHAYAIGSYTCNISADAGLSWVNRGTPGFITNAYRLHDGRFMHIGMGNAKTACCVANGTDAVCGTTCTSIGFGLRAGCRDHYSASFNAGQSRLCPRSFMNPQTGVVSTTYPTSAPNQTVISRRLQIEQADMTAASFPGALYFAESQYICTEDAVANNDLNNASYQRVTFDGAFNMQLQGGAAGVVQGQPAIYAWRANGLGLGVPDTSITILPVDVPGEGRFYLGYKVSDNGNGTWRYEYAIYNFSSDRSAGGVRVPTPLDANVTGIGFHSPNYHSDDVIYSNVDWTVPEPRPAHEIAWTTQGYSENQNASALRWGSMYNYWFTADTPPVQGEIELDLFKPGTGCVPQTIRVTALAPAGIDPADIARNGLVDADDLVEVVAGWGPCACPADCDADVDNNGAVDADDLTAVVLGWSTGK